MKALRTPSLQPQNFCGDDLVLLRGSATVGHTLRAGLFNSQGIGFPTESLTYRWQWHRGKWSQGEEMGEAWCDLGSPESGWTDLDAATAPELVVSPALVGCRVRVVVVQTSSSQICSSPTSPRVSAPVLIATHNPIVLENRRSGTRNWKITRLATDGEIAGYGDAPSVQRGETLNLKVSLAEAGNYGLEVYRLGYYGGKGGRLITCVHDLWGTPQAAARLTNPNTRLVECDWQTSYSLQTGRDWTTGIYLVKLIDNRSGKQTYIPFVVRDDRRPADLGLLDAVTTAQAYNNYGGYSVYDANSIGAEPAQQVSFDRPYAPSHLGLSNSDGYNCNNLLTWEYNMVRWLESQGYDVSYFTNLDLGTNPRQLASQQVFLSAGHDEYWSMAERDHLQRARDSGIHLAFFSANTGYWQVRYTPSQSGQPNRVITVYKDTSRIGQGRSLDPLAQTCPQWATTLFRSPEVGRPENALLGVGYVSDHGSVYRGYDFVVSKADDPYYANTGLKNGDRLRGLVGYEWDGLLNNGAAPTGLVVLACSPVRANSILPPLPPGTDPNVSHAVRYTAPSGARVFATGSIQWVWGLDQDWVSCPAVEPNGLLRFKNWLRALKWRLLSDSAGPKLTRPRVDRRAQQIAVNVLADMGARPQTPAAHLVIPPPADP